MSTQVKGKRSSVREKPQRDSGHSLEREIERLFQEELSPYVGMTVVAIMAAVIEFWLWSTESSPQPGLFVLFAVLVTLYGVYKFARARRHLADLALGLERDKSVGQMLEQLRNEGCQIVHDVAGDGLNADHIVVSLHGIFVVETKSFRKPARGNAQVEYDGERVLVNGIAPARDPVTQALALRSWVQDLLAGVTGKRFSVKAVLLFPGWDVVNPLPDPRQDLWVLNPKDLPARVAKEPISSSPHDVSLVTSRLAPHVRTHE